MVIQREHSNASHLISRQFQGQVEARILLAEKNRRTLPIASYVIGLQSSLPSPVPMRRADLGKEIFQHSVLFNNGEKLAGLFRFAQGNLVGMPEYPGNHRLITFDRRRRGQSVP